MESYNYYYTASFCKSQELNFNGSRFGIKVILSMLMVFFKYLFINNVLFFSLPFILN